MSRAEEIYNCLIHFCRRCGHERLAHSWVVNTNNNGTQPVHEECREDLDCGIGVSKETPGSREACVKSGNKWVTSYKCFCEKFVPHTLLDISERIEDELATRPT
jgi:hypothetical protein